MPQLSDPHRSRAVLIGVSAHVSLPALPTVDNNVTGLAAALTDPARWGIPAENCTTIRDPRSPREVQDALWRAAAAVEPDGLLLIYFAGHGIADTSNGELHLAVATSRIDAAYATAVPYEWVRRIVRESPAGRRVVILDCCYAGRAIAGMGSADSAVAAEVEIDKSCVLVAASVNRLALAPPEETYTAFTGVLLDLLDRGVVGAPDPLDLTTIYDEMYQILRRLGRPLPELRARNGGERIPLVRNMAATTSYPGQIFVADARRADPGLAAATIAILAYSPAIGALGVRLDRLTARSPADLLGEHRASALEAPSVFDGGPVGDVVLLVVSLRDAGAHPNGFTPISGILGTLPLTAEPALLEATVENACLFVGYLGWPAGQLEFEIGQGALVPARATLVDWLAQHVQAR